MKARKTTTLADIAREVGVTSMAASVVLNGARSTARVSASTRARILDAAERLKYRPNAVARGLLRSRMDSIGVLAVVDGGELNVYFLEVLNGILEAAAARSQNVTVFSMPDWVEASHQLLDRCDGRVDGLILIAPDAPLPPLEEAISRGTRVVSIHANGPLPGAWNLDIDNEAGALMAVRRLLDAGHRRIMHLTGNPGVTGAEQRLAGYRKALEERRIPFDPALVLQGHYAIGSGRARMSALLDSGAPLALPSAIFCASDAIASGCMDVLAERGLRVPADVSVVGYDDTLLARMTSPALTTVRQPFRDLGRRALEKVVELIEDPAADDESRLPATEVFPVELVERGSVGPPRQR